MIVTDVDGTRVWLRDRYGLALKKPVHRLHIQHVSVRDSSVLQQIRDVDASYDYPTLLAAGPGLLDTYAMGDAHANDLVDGGDEALDDDGVVNEVD